LLLAFGSKVNLVSESNGTLDHMLLPEVSGVPSRTLQRQNSFYVIQINPVRTSQETHYVPLKNPTG
jgi:hypothetical protein